MVLVNTINSSEAAANFTSLLDTEETVFMEFRPEFAQYILGKYGEGNSRKLSPVRVGRLLLAMENGTYDPRIIPLHFTTEHRLDNGQHRLTAAGKRQANTLFKVEFGMSPAARSYYDKASSSRTARDLVGAEGYDWPAAPQQLKIMAYYKTGGSVSKGMDYTPENIAAVPAFCAYGKQGKHLAGNLRSVYSAMAALLLDAGYSPETIDEFLVDVEETGKRDNSAAYYIRLAGEDMKTGSTADEDYLALLIHGFNKWIKRVPVYRRFKTSLELSRIIPPAIMGNGEQCL